MLTCRPSQLRQGSMGKPAPYFHMGIIGPSGEELKDGEEGELAIRTDKGAGSCWIFKGAYVFTSARGA